MTRGHRPYCGLARLALLIVRRDRLRMATWIGLLGGVIAVSAASLPPLYPDQQAIDDYAALVGDNPALVALAGPGYGMDRPTLGFILVNETQLWGMIGLALMAVFLTVRTTRAEEDVERAELIRSSVVGRRAPTLAAVTVVVAAVTVLSAGCAAAFVMLGYDGVGSLALAGSMGAVGWMFTGVSVVAAQLAGSARMALTSSLLILMTAFLLRAIGDVGTPVLRWSSPLGWAQAVRAFAGEAWWTLALCAASAMLLVLAGFVLAEHRDLGAGFIAPRPGPSHARRLRLSWQLAWRQHRATVAAWSIGMFVGGAVYASVADDVADLVSDNPAFADLLVQLQGADLVDAFFATAITLLGAVSAGAVVAAVVRLRTEEVSGRLEALWAMPLSRWRWAAGHLAVITVGAFVVMSCAGLGLGVTYAWVVADPDRIVRLWFATLVTAPAVAVLGAVGLLVVGWAPRVIMATWVVLGIIVIIDFFGEILRLPGWVRTVSPFRHLPSVPAEPMRWSAWFVTLGVAAVMGLVGLIGLRRRDLMAS